MSLVSGRTVKPERRGTLSRKAGATVSVAAWVASLEGTDWDPVAATGSATAGLGAAPVGDREATGAASGPARCATFFRGGCGAGVDLNRLRWLFRVPAVTVMPFSDRSVAMWAM